MTVIFKEGLILALIIYVRVVAPQSVPRCEKITTPLCQHLGYNTTLMPNFMGHDDQRAAALALQTYGPLLQHNCSSFLRLFVCSVYIPLCSEDVSSAIPACRGLCEEVKKDCLFALHSVGFSWPSELNCSKFPEPPNLCMQQPSEEDFKDVSPGEHLHGLRTITHSCPLNTVPSGNQRCLRKCDNNELYDQSDKTLYSIWTIFWSISCLLVTMCSLLTFLTQPKRFRWPARPLLYLSFCGFVRCIVFLIRWIVGPLICSDAAILEKPTDSLGCTSLALLLVYTDVATCLWWCIFCFVWYLSAAKEWSTEALEKVSTRLHAVVWSLSTVPLIFVLISRNIDLNELTGFCQISSYVLVIFELCFVLVGLSLAAFTAIALKNVRKALMCEGRCPYKLERLILRLGIISLGICAGLFFSLLCNFFDNLYVVLLQVALQFLSAIFASLWVFSSKTFKSWNKLLRPSARNKSLQNMPSTKI